MRLRPYLFNSAIQCIPQKEAPLYSMGVASSLVYIGRITVLVRQLSSNSLKAANTVTAAEIQYSGRRTTKGEAQVAASRSSASPRGRAGGVVAQPRAHSCPLDPLGKTAGGGVA